MSWEALNWASKQRTRACSTQVVLYVLANAADPNGVAMDWWKGEDHWWQYLIDRTRLKRASLYRIMNELEAAGALTVEWRIPRPGEKKRAVVHLNLQCTISEKSEAESMTETPSETGSTQSQPNESTIETPSNTGVHQGDIYESTSETGVYTATLKKIPEIPTPTPPLGGVSSEDEIREAKESFERFRDVYPIVIEDEPRTLAIWQKLSPADRDVRTIAARRYADEIKKNKRTPYAAHRWLGDGSPKRMGRWQGYAKMPDPGTATRVECRLGGSCAVIWENLHTIAGAGKPFAMKLVDGGSGYALARAPTPQMEAASALLSVVSGLQTFPVGSAQHGAWHRFLMDTIGKPLRHDGVAVRVPAPFPPRVDGSLSPDIASTDPPAEPHMTDDDIAELTKSLRDA